MELAAGQILKDRYRLREMLGRGGMGVVWAAEDAQTGSSVAVKLVLAGGSPGQDLRRRFLREARTVAQITHPNVVDLLDVFEHDDEMPVLVMPLLEGETLRARLDREGSLDVEACAEVFVQVVSAVGACHAARIVHRDLKPENVFATEQRIKVLDFGVAKLMLGSDTLGTLTSTGTSLGTPCYMAPEQAFAERDVDHRADIWSIGAMIYESLAGCRPVEGENRGQILKRFLQEAVTPIGALLPDLPGDLQELVMRMLAIERRDRPADLQEVHALLRGHTRVESPGFGAPG